MESIKIVGTSAEDLKSAVEYICKIKNTKYITHAKFYDKYATCHDLTGNSKNEINKHFDNSASAKEYGLLPIITPLDGYLSMICSWWENKDEAESYGDGTTVKDFTIYYGYDYGDIPQLENVKFGNIAVFHIVLGKTYYGK